MSSPPSLCAHLLILHSRSSNFFVKLFLPFTTTAPYNCPALEKKVELEVQEASDFYASFSSSCLQSKGSQSPCPKKTKKRNQSCKPKGKGRKDGRRPSECANQTQMGGFPHLPLFLPLPCPPPRPSPPFLLLSPPFSSSYVSKEMLEKTGGGPRGKRNSEQMENGLSSA